MQLDSRLPDSYQACIPVGHRSQDAESLFECSFDVREKESGKTTLSRHAWYLSHREYLRPVQPIPKHGRETVRGQPMWKDAVQSIKDVPIVIVHIDVLHDKKDRPFALKLLMMFLDLFHEVREID